MGELIFDLKKNQDKVNLIISGDLTMGNASKLKGAMLSALNTELPVYLEIKEVEDVDVSFFQLICALHRSGISKGFELEVKHPFPEKVREKAVILGWKRAISCVVGRGHECVWVKEFSDGKETVNSR